MIQEINMDYIIKDGMNGLEHILKRTFDIMVSLIALVILFPVLIVIVILIYREKSGPIFFKQERIGQGGKPFQMLKFRTMPVNYEADGPNLSAHGIQSSTPLMSTLREHHLDELPQLWNIFIGDMSFVGPRPERKYFIDMIMANNPDYVYIYTMRPGLTSWATIYNGYTDTMEKMLIRLQMDLTYLQKRPLWTDLKIILTTANYIINGKKI
ncbi:MAG: sugar transferase [Bacteroidaceae bacterium]